MMIKIRETLNYALKIYREAYINTSKIEAITFIEDGNKFKVHVTSGKDFRCDPEYLENILELMD